MLLKNLIKNQRKMVPIFLRQLKYDVLEMFWL